VHREHRRRPASRTLDVGSGRGLIRCGRRGRGHRARLSSAGRETTCSHRRPTCRPEPPRRSAHSPRMATSPRPSSCPRRRSRRTSAPVGWPGASVRECPLRRSSGACQTAGFGRSRNRSRFSPSMMSAVSPSADLISCSSASCQKTASPASIGSSTPAAPLTSPDPSSTARICGKVAGCRRSRPLGSTRKIAAWTGDPSEMD
jgi:hypothetical protein